MPTASKAAHSQPVLSPGQPNAEYRALLNAVKARLKADFRGHEDLIEFSLATFLARGHLMLEGPAGTGKTSLAKSIAQAFGGSFRRIQMTSDLLPSDVVGILRLKPGTQEFEFRRGPVFAHFLLADELNRTSPKTQGALLEAMAEGTVTVDGVSHSLPKPFFVIATQNPAEFQGVYPLAESQVDRFMLQLVIGTPEKSDELEIYRNIRKFRSADSHAPVESIMSIEVASALMGQTEQVHVEETVLEYALDLVRATRHSAGVAHGVSVRGGLQLIAAAKGLSFLRGQDFVSPREISDLAVPALAHRLCFSSGELDAGRRAGIIREIIQKVRAPR